MSEVSNTSTSSRRSRGREQAPREGITGDDLQRKFPQYVDKLVYPHVNPVPAGCQMFFSSNDHRQRHNLHKCPEPRTGPMPSAAYARCGARGSDVVWLEEPVCVLNGVAHSNRSATCDILCTLQGRPRTQDLYTLPPPSSWLMNHRDIAPEVSPEPIGHPSYETWLKRGLEREKAKQVRPRHRCRLVRSLAVHDVY